MSCSHPSSVDTGVGIAVDSSISSEEISGFDTATQLPYDEDEFLEIIKDTERFSDPYLRAEANKALKILDSNDYRLRNKPTWVSRLEDLAVIARRFELKDNYTTRKMFEAMYTSAESCGLPSAAQRYVSAVTYASALKADALFEDKNARRNALANALEQLATTWVAYMLWPFVKTSILRKLQEYEDILDAKTPTVQDTTSEHSSSDLTPRRCDFRSSVARRDGYTCCFTGALDRSAPKGYVDKLNAGGEVRKKAHMNTAHIFKRVAVVWEDDVNEAKTASRRATYDILRHYCQLEGSLDEIVHAIDMPENGIYVNSYSREGFDIFEWCLQPTEIDNRYKICLMPSFPNNALIGQPEGHTHVSFVDHSETGIALPRKDLLRLHAAIGHVLHLSGAAGLLELLGEECGGAGGAAGISVAPVGVDFMDKVVRGGAWEAAELAASVAAMFASDSPPRGL